jgi:hypothetical protein
MSSRSLLADDRKRAAAMSGTFDKAADPLSIGQGDAGEKHVTVRSRLIGEHAGVTDPITSGQGTTEPGSPAEGCNGRVEMTLSRLEPDGGELEVTIGELRLRVSVRDRRVVALTRAENAIAEELSGCLRELAHRHVATGTEWRISVPSLAELCGRMPRERRRFLADFKRLARSKHVTNYEFSISNDRTTGAKLRMPDSTAGAALNGKRPTEPGPMVVIRARRPAHRPMP